MNKKPQSITFQRAAAELCVSDSTVKRLVRRGTLHTTKPELVDGHWTRRIIPDKSFLDELTRRVHGLKAPRRKHIPDTDSVEKEFERNAREQRMNEICEQWCKEDPSTIQTVTPPAEQEPATEEDYNRFFAELREASTKQKSELTQAAMLERAENAMNICLEAQKNCKELEESIYQSHATTECWVNKWLLRLGCSEGIYTRCTAIVSAACVLLILLAIYFSLCHFNII